MLSESHMARMPRPPREPGYCLHKPSNRGYARFGRGARPTYFPGPYGSPESLAAYHRAKAEWLAGGRALPLRTAQTVTVEELIAEWWPVAERRYRKYGRQTSELSCQRTAFRPLRELFGPLPAAEFGADQMELLQRHMATLADPHTGLSWVRPSINLHCSRIRALFKWGARRKLVPAAVLAELQTVPGLRPGDGAREPAAKKPVPAHDVGCVLLCACPPVRAMIRLQLLNGIRPGGVCALRPCDVDRSGELWLYVEPVESAAKTGKERHWLGPKAQAVLAPWLDVAADQAAPVFRPPNARSRGWYTVDAYRLYIARLCRRLGVPHWHPHRLRHNHGTDVRRLYGAEAARVRLGHERLETTEIYAEPNAALAQKVAREIG